MNDTKLKGIVEKAKELAKYLECDGSTRILNYLLTENRIPHTVLMGEADYNGIHLPVHFWITSGDYIIDNKSHMYFGEEVPEGMFKESPVTYSGAPVSMDTSKTIFDILTFDHQPYLDELRKRARE